MQSTVYPGLLTPTCQSFRFSSLLILCFLAGLSAIPLPVRVPWFYFGEPPLSHSMCHGLTLPLSPRDGHRNTRSSAGQTGHPTSPAAVTDWFRIVQVAQAWPLRGRPKALAETLGKEHSPFQMRDHLLATIRGEAMRRKAIPEGIRAQR